MTDTCRQLWSGTRLADLDVDYVEPDVMTVDGTCIEVAVASMLMSDICVRGEYATDQSRATLATRYLAPQ